MKCRICNKSLDPFSDDTLGEFCWEHSMSNPQNNPLREKIFKILRNNIDWSNIHESLDNGTAADELVTLFKAAIAEAMPTDAEIITYFDNHFDCFANADTIESAMTVEAVLKMFEWFRNRMGGKEK